MRTGRLSLRARLTLVILLPLLVIALLVGGWAYSDAQANAAERFDRSLLSTALAISRDTAVSGGDALSEETRDLLRDTSGGAVFYHVYAPDGVFVTGYATPPVLPSEAASDAAQIYYDGVYLGEPVRALRFTQNMAIDGLNGPFTFTVWQNTAVRDGFLQSRTQPTFLIIASMVGALALIVWFGVRFGLTPLIDLEEAISRRSSDDLSEIRRAIPPEVSGIVGRLNSLLTDMAQTLTAKDVFISDAAHQLRNPIAGVLSLAESLQGAQTLEDAKSRGADLLDAARETGTLANNLLTLERARATPQPGSTVDFDAIAKLQGVAEQVRSRAEAGQIKVDTRFGTDQAALHGDPVLFEQGVLNLLNNALAHGGPGLSRVTLGAARQDGNLVITVADDGKGIDAADTNAALRRFSQVGPSAGSGLGLPITKAIVEQFGGAIGLGQGADGFTVTLTLPLTKPETHPAPGPIPAQTNRLTTFSRIS